MELHTYLTGVSFRPTTAKMIVAQLAVGDTLDLERDPNNPYDANAIAVYAEGEHLGFIPKEHNVDLAAAMDAGAEPICTVISEDAKKPGLTVEF